MVELSRRQRERRRQRQEILDEAEHLFAVNGYHETTMDALAESTQWSKGGLYLHFKSKEELFFSLLDSKLTDLINTLRSVLNDTRDLEEALEVSINRMFTFFQNHRDLFHLLMTEQGKSLRQSHADTFREPMLRRQAEFMATLTTRFRDLMPCESVVSARSLTLTLTGSIMQHLAYWLTSDHSMDLRTAQSEIMELLKKGIFRAES